MNHQKIVTGYDKRKNSNLFECFLKDGEIKCTGIQNFSPILTRFFSLNETNYNSVCFKQKNVIKKVVKNIEDSHNIYKCSIVTIKDDDYKNDNKEDQELGLNDKDLEESKNVNNKEIFFKFAPLVDPYKFLLGKYNDVESKLFQLPSLHSNHLTDDVHPKLIDINNCAYVDGLFSFLSSHLLHNYQFVHALDFYGSFVAIKENYKLNVADDIEYLHGSDYFKRNNGVKFHVDDYNFLINQIFDDDKKKPPIQIDHTSTNKSDLSIHSINDELYGDLFEKADSVDHIISLDDLKDGNLGLLENPELNVSIEANAIRTLRSNSSGTSCSSRTSYTDIGDKSDQEDEEIEDDNINDERTDKDDKKDDEEWEDCSTIDEDDIYIEATIPQFPTNIICMENCDGTFDDLIAEEELSKNEWFSALMQIIMILLVYQKTFAFTHNDLHTNNVMYINTDKKFVYYKYNDVYYKVPTCGRIMKIIDFGRSIYKYDKHIYCSDSFQPGADAATQYNTEPYFNESKPRLDPNFSFDLCRLGCSIFDYLVEELEDMETLRKKDPVANLIIEWCTDDKGLNVLYKKNGDERYPDFKLYKMIARCVHKHTPASQLERDIFKNYIAKRSEIPKKAAIMNIDKLPKFYH